MDENQDRLATVNRKIKDAGFQLPRVNGTVGVIITDKAGEGVLEIL